MSIMPMLFRCTTQRRRVDITPALALIMYVVVVVLGALMVTDSFYEAIMRFGLNSLLVGVLLGILYMMGSTLLASLISVVLILVTTSELPAADMIALTIGVVAAGNWLAYLRQSTRLSMVVVGLMTGFLAALYGKGGTTLLVLFTAVLSARVIWHLLFERLSKRALLAFIAKASVAALLSAGAYISVRSQVALPMVAGANPSLAFSQPIVVILTTILALRGLWAISLLNTQRSPESRSLRFFNVLSCAGILALVTLLGANSSAIFAPGFIDRLDSVGLVSYGLLTSIVIIINMLLLVQTGIDHSLYKDARLGCYLVPKLKTATGDNQ